MGLKVFFVLLFSLSWQSGMYIVGGCQPQVRRGGWSQQQVGGFQGPTFSCNGFFTKVVPQNLRNSRGTEMPMTNLVGVSYLFYFLLIYYLL